MLAQIATMHPPVIAVFDLETTSANPKSAQPVQVGLAVAYPDRVETYEQLCHPGAAALASPTYAGAAAVHGITREQVVDMPAAADVVACFVEHLDNAGVQVVVGYNIVDYDLRIAPAFAKGRAVIDVYRLLVRLAEEMPLPSDGSLLHPEGLAGLKLGLGKIYAALFGRSLEGAHGALQDARATLEVLCEVLRLWRTYLNARTVPGSWYALAAYLETPPAGWSDWKATFKRTAGSWECQIGDHRGCPIEHMDRGFLRWMLNKDFPDSTKKLVRSYL